MSNSPIIPKEKLSAYQRWELNSFNENQAHAAPSAQQTAEQEFDQLAYQRGLADGVRQGAAKAASEMQMVRTLLSSINRQSSEINQQLADELLELALEIARRLVHDTLEVRRDAIVPVVQEAIAQLARPLAQPILTLCPQDAAVVREHMGEQLIADGWKIVEDPTLARGGCKLHTLASQADATLGVRWQHLTAALGKSTPWLK
jgi:flagellar assembly protein FliH